MLPAVHEVVGVEMIRDGGSLAATFKSDGTSRYILLFRIHIADRGPLEMERLGYHGPILIDCDPGKGKPNTDSVVYSELTGPSISVSWNQARDILDAMAYGARGLRPLDAKLLQDMIFVSAHEGCLPRGFERLMHVRRP
jgi:hypothetical protein